MGWSQLVGTLTGGLLVILTNFVSGRQQERRDQRRLQVETRKALRQEKLAIAHEFFAMARIMEGYAVDTYHHKGIRNASMEEWNTYWNTQVMFDFILEVDSRQALGNFADRLRRAIRGENKRIEVWAYLQDSRNLLRDALREEFHVDTGL